MVFRTVTDHSVSATNTVPLAGRRRTAIVITIVAALAVIVVQWVLNTVVLGNFVIDDAFLSYRYADNLVAGNGLVFNLGQRVEGYSNFLWVMLVAAGRLFGIDPVAFSKASAALLSAGIVVVISIYVWRAKLGVLALIASLFLLLSELSFHAFSQLGLENALLAFVLILGFVAALSGPTLWSTLALVPIVLARVDGFIYVPALLAVMALRNKTQHGRYVTRQLVLASAFGALTIIAYHGFRYAYYGDIVPTTGITKFPVKQWFGSLVNGDLDAIWAALKGFLRYTAYGVLRAWSYWVIPNLAYLVVVLTAFAWRRPVRTLTPGLLIVAVHFVWWTVFGADWTPGRRYTALVPMLAIMFGEAVTVHVQNLLPRRALLRRGAMAALAAVTLFGVLELSPVNPNVSLASWWFDRSTPIRQVGRIGIKVINPKVRTPNSWFYQHPRSMVQRATLGMFVAALTSNDSQASQMTLAASGEGAAPYYSNLRVITRFGLADKELAAAQDGGGGHGDRLPDSLWLWRHPEFITADSNEYALFKDIAADYTRVELKVFDITPAEVNWLFVRNDVLNRYAKRMDIVKARDGATDFNSFNFDYTRFRAYFADLSKAVSVINPSG